MFNLRAFFAVSLAASLLAATARAEPPRRIGAIDDPAPLFAASAPVENLAELDASAAKSVSFARPWGDYAWALDQGLIARRYADGAFGALPNFSERYAFVEAHPASARDEDRLSPAEKYDLLVGDSRGTLTRAIWETGKQYQDAGILDAWYGICEGSSAASVQVPEPVRAVTLRLPHSDRTVTFHALDVKALASLLWSAYVVRLPVTGGHCKTSHPERDASGAVTDPECFSVNPATWHVSLLNLMGLQKQRLFMDRSSNTEEVWNSPVVSYDFHYVNPVTGLASAELADAVVPIAGYAASDPYRAHRASEARSIVGVVMNVVVGSGAKNIPRDGSADAALLPSVYRYDLELDASGKIIGGEWNGDRHPNFLWTIPAGTRPASRGDAMLPAGARWDAERVPGSWLPAAEAASADVQPLAAVVNRLIELSR